MLKQLPCIPLVENLLKDGTDGCALAALIHFYCPGVVRLEGKCSSEILLDYRKMVTGIKTTVAVFSK